ncbi:MAG: SIS domain-containing protein [Tannerellaceae bacterium]|jgi:glucosamine--fructose-6-phosphate aminotransferase (isomerizing)|nr:SIS domain-containing protein [Tannerellaceae bacterium]
MEKTIQEILFQPHAWRKTINAFNEQKNEILNFFENHRKATIIMTGCGSSYYLPLIGSALYTRFTGKESMGIPASEILLNPETVFANDQEYLLISISRSGKTPETLSAVRYMKDNGKGGTMLISCTGQSEIAKYADFSIICPDAAEETKYMTKSFTSMLLCFQLMTACISKNKLFEKELLQLPEHGERLIKEYQLSLQQLANEKDFDLYVFLGHGPYFGVASEAMLKTKEMACTPAEAYHGMEFMHGPKYAVNRKTIITCLMSESIKKEEIELLKKVKPLGGYIMVICENSTTEITDLANNVFELKSGLSENTTPVLSLLLTQLFGYYKALAVGKDL